MPPLLVPEYTWLGSHGTLQDSDGTFLSNIQEVTFQVTVNRQDIMLAGSRRVGYKMTDVTGDGTMRGFRVTSQMARRVVNPMINERDAQFVGNIIVSINDPEMLQRAGVAQSETIQLNRCKWWGIGLGWSVGTIIEEDTPFTFQSMTWLSEVQGNVSLATVEPTFNPPVPPPIP